MAETKLTIEQVEAFLAERHGGAAISDLVPLSGGFWSSAFAYRPDDQDRELVVRFGQLDDAFEADQRAMEYSSDELPVPEILEVGWAFDGSFAISVRAFGRFLEDVTPHQAGIAGPTIVRLLGALHAATPAVSSEPPDAWRRYLAAGFVDDPKQAVHGWRDKLATVPDAEQVFVACEARVLELADAVCPERRDLLHGDLLHKNVLISDDASRVNAVFSWKCSVRGDFLFDTAWCTFWGHVHPGIAAADVWHGVTASEWANADPSMLTDAALRHHCYELQIGGAHLGWYAWTGDADLLRSSAAYTASLLERGPLDER